MTRPTRPLPLLFLVADTGGGHRSVADAVAQALRAVRPGAFVPVLVDPLCGPDAHPALRWTTRLYGPLTRRTPRLWGAVYHCSAPRPVLELVRGTLLSRADAAVTAAMTRHDPAAVVSFHPLLTRAAVRASRGRVPVTTVVTDLVTAHPAWYDPGVDTVAVPSAALRQRTPHCVETGLPVTEQFWTGPLGARARLRLRRVLGLGDAGFVVVLAGGAEGSGDILGQASALLAGTDVHVVAVSGRNRDLRRRLDRLAVRAPGRLTVHGFVRNMADWLRAADLVATKAGPSTIAEATCCGAPLVVTSYLPGQERGNVELVVRAGAGRYAASTRDLVRTVDELRGNPLALDAMRRSSARLGRPGAAVEVADLVAQSVLPVQQHGRPA